MIVWCDTLDGHIGFHFFYGNVIGESYLRMLREVLPRMLEFVDENTVQRMWLQQDGGTTLRTPCKGFFKFNLSASLD